MCELRIYIILQVIVWKINPKWCTSTKAFLMHGSTQHLRLKALSARKAFSKSYLQLLLHLSFVLRFGRVASSRMKRNEEQHQEPLLLPRRVLQKVIMWSIIFTQSILNRNSEPRFPMWYYGSNPCVKYEKVLNQKSYAWKRAQGPPCGADLLALYWCDWHCMELITATVCFYH